MKKKKIIIAIIVVLVLIIAAVIGTVLFLNSREDEDDEKTKKLEWGEVYLEVLDDEKKLEDIEDTQIQLCDLDKDDIPELIIYGIDSAKRYLANIYKINDKNEVDTIKVSLDEEFELKLFYNLEKEDYIWYAVVKGKNDSTNEIEITKIYDLNIENKKYEPELLEISYKNDLIEVEDNYSEKVEFDKTAKKSEKEKVLQSAKETYVKTADMITEEVEKKVEMAKVIKNVKKVSDGSELVYSGKEIIHTEGTSDFIYKYPVINIDSSDVEKINIEIKNTYGFRTYEDILNNSAGECEEIGYKYFINNKILSLLVYTGGNSSLWCEVYNIDLETLKQVSGEDILKEYGLNKNTVVEKATTAGVEKFEEVRLGEQDMWSVANDIQKEYDSWREEIKDEIAEANTIFINENGEVCMLAKVQHLGGQYSCWKTIIINISKDYEVSEFNYAKLISDSTYGYNRYRKNTSTTTSSQTTTATTTSPTPSTTSKTSESSSSLSTSDKPTNATISQDEALKLAQSVFGEDKGYFYCGWGNWNGKQYYVFDVKFNLGDHFSYATTVCVEANGKSYEQIGIVQSQIQNGSALSIEEGYGGTF